MGRKSYHITSAMLELSDPLLALMYSLDLSLFLSKQSRMLCLQVVFDLICSICADEHFLQRPELVSSFKFPHRVFKPKQFVTRDQIRTFYCALETTKEKALFLLYATSGLRRQEILFENTT